MSMHGGLVVGCIAASIAVGCSAAPTAPVAERTGTVRAAGMTAFPNDQTVYDYFRGQGFTDFQAAGIVGNLDQESGIDPTISQQNGGPGRGIAQWSAGGRWDTDPGDNLMAFAAMEGASPTALQTQLDFIMFELTMFPNYGLATLKASTNVTDATTDFELDFEGCAIASECDGPSRINYAMSILAAYGNDPVPDAGGGSGDDAGSGSSDAGSGTGDDGGGGTAADAGAESSSGGSSGTGSGGSGSSGGSSGGGGGGTSGGSGGGASGGAGSGGTGGGSASSSGGSSGAGESFASSQGSACSVAEVAGPRGDVPLGWLVALTLGLRRLRRRAAPRAA
jgi:hypothetical protein